ncbi:fasciclin [Halomonas campaniensis]|uniref:Fasciclin domain-containing protein n=1 Tax=Vreelandella alkaliphila TaxID=272774 RepID=A0AAJ2RTX0_9GAMM|nr:MULTISPECIES: fasciclin domain-containing protein [Halomonas]AIA73956.1 fasciclin [Halomonas campaniensis]MCD6005441.1 fasciclin domain-containing protein [Halomonas sp. IOP_6]MCD6438660.1 fasciclin domain-containing protein [Halomonas sp.]MDX5977451.1 fasciclin domain-containing protein [Halomonas alkaliphila]
MKLKLLTASLCAAALYASAAVADHGPTMVGGASMLPERNIIENAVNSGDHETLVAAVQAAELVDVLQGDGPFTVFAPTDKAFADLPDGTVDTLLQPENLEQLQTVLTYHVVPGNLTRDALWEEVMENDGTVAFKTVQGGHLSVIRNGNNLMVMDAQGNSANITVIDVAQANGVIHVVDRVLMP